MYVWRWRMDQMENRQKRELNVWIQVVNFMSGDRESGSGRERERTFHEWCYSSGKLDDNQSQESRISSGYIVSIIFSYITVSWLCVEVLRMEWEEEGERMHHGDHQHVTQAEMKIHDREIITLMLNYCIISVWVGCDSDQVMFTSSNSC